MIKLLVITAIFCQVAFIVTDDIDTDQEDENLERKITFANVESRSGNIEMTLGEINEIFDKKKHKKNKLSRGNKKKAKNCRKRGLLLSVQDRKCHEPTLQGPCKNGEWFVAVKRKLQGFCKRKQCTSEEKPIMSNGTCSAVYGSCPQSSRLYLNKRGKGFCDCDDGFSFNVADNTCHREHMQGPCAETKSWKCRKAPKKNKKGHRVFGRCKETRCGDGEVEWRDNKCYKVDSGEIFDKCLENRDGELVLVDGVVTCNIVASSRALAMQAGRSCRRGGA